MQVLLEEGSIFHTKMHAKNVSKGGEKNVKKRETVPDLFLLNPEEVYEH